MKRKFPDPPRRYEYDRERGRRQRGFPPPPVARKRPRYDSREATSTRKRGRPEREEWERRAKPRVVVVAKKPRKVSHSKILVPLLGKFGTRNNL